MWTPRGCATRFIFYHVRFKLCIYATRINFKCLGQYKVNTSVTTGVIMPLEKQVRVHTKTSWGTYLLHANLFRHADEFGTAWVLLNRLANKQSMRMAYRLRLWRCRLSFTEANPFSFVSAFLLSHTQLEKWKAPVAWGPTRSGNRPCVMLMLVTDYASNVDLRGLSTTASTSNINHLREATGQHSKTWDTNVLAAIRKCKQATLKLLVAHQPDNVKQ